jgi:hypothetical protein
MNLRFNKTRGALFAAIFITLSAWLAYSAEAGFFDKEEVKGTVIDTDTDLPIEGAYVMVIYRDSGGTFLGHSSSWCVKTKGMYTGKDGKFHFPLESKNPFIRAIKPDYFLSHHPPVFEESGGVLKVAPDPNIYLKRQDPAKPDFQLGDSQCERPKYREDVLANIEYLKIANAERVKYGYMQEGIDAVRRMIQRLERVPEKGASESK